MRHSRNYFSLYAKLFLPLPHIQTSNFSFMKAKKSILLAAILGVVAVVSCNKEQVL